MLESRRITTFHHHNAWFAIDRGLADEGWVEPEMVNPNSTQRWIHRIQ